LIQEAKFFFPSSEFDEDVERLKYVPEIFFRMVHIFMMYNVMPGKMEAYRKHSRTTDQPTLKMQPGIRNFTVYEIKGAQSGTSPYQIVEDIEVDSWEAFLKVAASDAGKKLGEMWKMYCDEASQITVFGDPI
jgi:uncharacterized protein (TIGR02118 family)